MTLGDGLSLVRGVALADSPPELRGDEYATVAVLALEAEAGAGQSLEQAGRRLRRLQTALRLWDDAEPALGPTAWARTDGGPWLAIPLATGLRRGGEDCLRRARGGGRAARLLLARRAAHAARRRAGVGAAALRARLRARQRARGADRLASVRPGAAGRRPTPGGDVVCERLAAICAVPAEREELCGRLRRATAMERSVVAGLVRPEPPVEALIAALGGCLRAVLRDVLCGHLEPELRRVADELLADARPAQTA